MTPTLARPFGWDMEGSGVFTADGDWLFTDGTTLFTGGRAWLFTAACLAVIGETVGGLFTGRVGLFTGSAV